ncbi:hypothetical protein WMY93_023560 [Mugilogobius chulae]|uniref:Follistatin-like domain-containing protein n=1 Tax=Mugilogobius chulae TaxID=88201 RepID=A0AAW0N928_9GOBI
MLDQCLELGLNGAVYHCRKCLGSAQLERGHRVLDLPDGSTVNALPPLCCSDKQQTLKMRLWLVLVLGLASQALQLRGVFPVMEEELIVEEEPAPEETLVEEEVVVEVGEFDEAIDPEEEVVEDTLDNPCLNHHCKKGKVCEVDESNTPMCVCQDPSTCPPADGEFEHCTLEGTKKGHKLHLDYIGPCKYIEQCVDTELSEFPLRMRDWLKNVLVTLYERDEENNLLTEKQKLRVKKIYESEKRLQAGEHSLDLLAHDFQKNYNMYIFPVHWQFGQLDQHPADGYLTHTELSPLRAPLIPMEHCTTRFFEECDADQDKYIALEEWAACFGIKDRQYQQHFI